MFTFWTVIKILPSFAYFLTLDTTKIEAAQFGWGSFGLLNYIAGDLHCF